MAIKLYISPMIIEPVKGGYNYQCYVDSQYPRHSNESRVVMRINQKSCLVAVDSKYADAGMDKDINLEQVLWGSPETIAIDAKTTLDSEFGLKTVPTESISTIYEKILARTLPKFDTAILKKWMADGRWHWIDLVTDEMKL